VVPSAARALAVSVPGEKVTLANSTEARKKGTGTGLLTETPFTNSCTNGALLYTWIFLVEPPFPGAFQLSTIRTVDDDVAAGIGGRPGSEAEMFASQTERYHHAGGFWNPARSIAPKEEDT